MIFKRNIFVLFCFIFCLFSIQISAKSIEIKSAVSIAETMLLRLNKANDFRIKNYFEIKTENKVAAYAFDLIPNGYIIVTANTDLPPIIAYSFESNFGELTDNNPLYSLIILDLKNRNNAITINNNNNSNNNLLWENLLNNKNIDTVFQQWPDVGDGWLTTNWTQNAPYNNFCPIDPVTSQRSIAGCPSVAMAMILNFHNTTNNTQFDNSDDYYHNYAGRQYWIDNDYIAHDFPSFSQLNSYLDTLNDHYANAIPLTNNDKAALTFACGVAATQVYTSSGSGTFGVNQAYDAYQRFNCNTAVLLDTTNIDLFPRLIQNMKDTLPAHLAIVNQTWTSGHNVVVDGYNTDNYFHLNFGWGGSYNGWYLIPQEIPYSLTVIEGVVLDIMKSPAASNFSNQNEDISLNIFPNPCTNKNATIKYYSLETGKIIIRIYTSAGKVIQNKEFFKNHESVEIPFNSENLSKGYYIIEFVTESKITRKPLIIK